MKYGVYVLIFFVGGGYALIKTWQTNASVGMKLLWTINILLMPLASLVTDLVARRADDDRPLA